MEVVRTKEGILINLRQWLLTRCNSLTAELDDLNDQMQGLDLEEQAEAHAELRQSWEGLKKVYDTYSEKFLLMYPLPSTQQPNQAFDASSGLYNSL